MTDTKMKSTKVLKIICIIHWTLFMSC